MAVAVVSGTRRRIAQKDGGLSLRDARQIIATMNVYEEAEKRERQLGHELSPTLKDIVESVAGQDEPPDTLSATQCELLHKLLHLAGAVYSRKWLDSRPSRRGTPDDAFSEWQSGLADFHGRLAVPLIPMIHRIPDPWPALAARNRWLNSTVFEPLIRAAFMRAGMSEDYRGDWATA
jgi:hypothetical protein